MTADVLTLRGVGGCNQPGFRYAPTWCWKQIIRPKQSSQTLRRVFIKPSEGRWRSSVVGLGGGARLWSLIKQQRWRAPSMLCCRRSSPHMLWSLHIRSAFINNWSKGCCARVLRDAKHSWLLRVRVTAAPTAAKLTREENFGGLTAQSICSALWSRGRTLKRKYFLK